MDYKTVILACILLATNSASFWAGKSSEELSNIKIEQAIGKGAKIAAETSAKAISEIEIKNTIINKKAIETIRVERVFTECRSPEVYEQIKELFK